LGLSLARRIGEDHNGRIDVTSAVSQGTTFAEILPLQKAQRQFPRLKQLSSRRHGGGCGDRLFPSAWANQAFFLTSKET